LEKTYGMHLEDRWVYINKKNLYLTIANKKFDSG